MNKTLNTFQKTWKRLCVRQKQGVSGICADKTKGSMLNDRIESRLTKKLNIHICLSNVFGHNEN